jgi:chemotaxis protein histidine kinase CheA
MAVHNDPDLESLFREELTERAASLAEGAKAIIDGSITSELASRMVREGHTIKGTGRVMGQEIIARGGETCEIVWRWIQHEELQATPMLGRAMTHLVEALPEALGGSGHDVSGAIDAIRTLVADPARLAELPEPMGIEPDPGPDPDPDPDSEPDPTPTPTPTVDVVIEGEGEIDGETASVGDVTADASLDDQVASQEPAAPEADAPNASQPPLPQNGTLVFEPDDDGKLQPPVVTVEIIRSAFAGGTGTTTPAHRPQPDEPAAVAHTTHEIDISFLDIEHHADGDDGPRYGLGGLAGAVESWAAEESLPVNAGRLFRLINDVAALRMDLESLSAHAGLALRSAEARSIPSADTSLEAMETARRAALELQERALGLTAVSLSTITSTLPQLMKYLSKKTGKSVELTVSGDDTIVDRQMVDRIGEAIRQLMINAVVHGIELPDDRVKSGKSSAGTVDISITSDKQHIAIEVSDDGAGIDWTAVREVALGANVLEGDPSAEDLRTALFSQGFSTNPRSSEFTQDGDGLSRITQIVEEVFGSFTMHTSREGSSFSITVPAHRALQSAQLFEAGGRSWGMPEAAVLDSRSIGSAEIEVTERGSLMTYEDEAIPYASFATATGLEIEGLPSEVLVVQSPVGPIALAVDRILEVREVATKDLGPLLSGSTVVTGVALLGGDDTVLLVDAGRLATNMLDDDARPTGPVHKVLVVDDSQGVRQVVSGVLASHGYATVSAGSVAEALGVLGHTEVDALVVDFSMPRADGVALIHLVRQRFGSIPIVMLSGVADAADKERAEKAGADAFFDKSDFAKGALVEKLDELIASSEPAEI